MIYKLKESSKNGIWLTRFGWIVITLLALISPRLLASAHQDWLISTADTTTLTNLLLSALGLLCVLATWIIAIAVKYRKIAKRNRIKETFAQSIQQLSAGSSKKPNIEARLDAIYSLEKLSQSNRELYQTIIDMLAEYVRENAPIPPHFEKAPSDSTRIDVQTAMTVLGRRKTRPTEPALNLHRVYLPQVNLGQANLQNADLMGADLRGANLTHAKLQGASLFNVDLLDANLVGANIRGTDLTAAKSLTSQQLEQARNWKSTYREPELACGADIPNSFGKYGPIAKTI